MGDSGHLLDTPQYASYALIDAEYAIIVKIYGIYLVFTYFIRTFVSLIKEPLEKNEYE